MAERHQYNHFSGGHLLQTRGDKKGFCPKKTQPKVSTPPPVDFSPPPVKTSRKGGIQQMD